MNISDLTTTSGSDITPYLRQTSNRSQFINLGVISHRKSQQDVELDLCTNHDDNQLGKLDGKYLEDNFVSIASNYRVSVINWIECNSP